MRPVIVTGGIGCGKSHAMGVIRNSFITNASFSNMDDEVAALYGLDIVKRFAINMYGTTDKKTIGQLVFNNPELRSLHDDFMLPLYQERLLQCLKPGAIVEVPVFFEMVMMSKNPMFLEALHDTHFQVLCIAANFETQVCRVMKRDNVSREDAVRRIRSQMPVMQKVVLSDETVYNDYGWPPDKLITDLGHALYNMGVV